MFENPPRCKGAAECVVTGIRFITILDEKMMIIASHVTVAPVAVITLVTVFNRNPLFKAVLGKYLITKVPFAHISCAVVTVPEQLRNTGDIGWQWYVVFDTAALMWPKSRHDGRAIRCTYRLCYIGVLEHDTLAGKLIKVGRMDFVIAISGHCVRTLLICPDKQEVRFLFVGTVGIS